MENNYLKDQIITYMGNKRKLLTNIETEVDKIKKKLNKDLTIGDGFSGSGIVSRLLKTKCDVLYSNDLAGYSHTLNTCYLSNPTESTINTLRTYIDKANKLAENEDNCKEQWVSKHWSPKNKNNIASEDRVYFTHENGKRIDIIRDYIETIPKKYRPYLLAPLLVESSIHNNTNGQFSAFYKNSDGIGKYGGKNSVDVKRITQPIQLKYPIFHNNECKTIVTKQDANEWAKSFKDKPLDIIYYDPPYNKHPYNIYYFMLDIINDWDKTIEIPKTNRGQPQGWRTSAYNSVKNAKNSMKNLLENTHAKYVILSYNDGGIIPIAELDNLIKEVSKDMEKIPIVHKTYNRLKGISNYKRENEYKPVKEFLYVIKLT